MHPGSGKREDFARENIGLQHIFNSPFPSGNERIPHCFKASLVVLYILLYIMLHPALRLHSPAVIFCLPAILTSDKSDAYRCFSAMKIVAGLPRYERRMAYSNAPASTCIFSSAGRQRSTMSSSFMRAAWTLMFIAATTSPRKLRSGTAMVRRPSSSSWSTSA